MRCCLLVSLVWVGCLGPKLPPVPAVTPASSVDFVPAQARADVLRARLALEGGHPDDALAAARRAANLDQSAAAPWALVAEAACAAGDRAMAQQALAEAISREPDVLQLRMLRLSLVPLSDDAILDLEWLVGQSAQVAQRPWVAVRLGRAAEQLNHPAALALAQTAARARLATDDPSELAAVVALLDAPSAVLVGGLRLHHAGLLSESGRSAAKRAASALAVPPVMMPQDWRLADSVDSPVESAGYPLDASVAFGWQAAVDGRTDEAVALLTTALQADPADPTPRELLWLMQDPAPLSAGARPAGLPETLMECP